MKSDKDKRETNKTESPNFLNINSNICLLNKEESKNQNPQSEIKNIIKNTENGDRIKFRNKEDKKKQQNKKDSFTLVQSKNSELVKLNEKHPNYITPVITSVNKILNNGDANVNCSRKEEEKNNPISQDETNNATNNHSKSKTSLKYFKKLNCLENSEKCQNPLCNKELKSHKEKYIVKVNGLKQIERKLCDECFDSVLKNQFCFYCNTIYRDKLSDNLIWIQCDKCSRWIHSKCEIEKGKNYQKEKDLLSTKTYICPVCIKDNEKKHKIDSKIKTTLIKKKRKGDIIDSPKSKNIYEKNLRDIRAERCSELLQDIELIESIINTPNDTQS